MTRIVGLDFESTGTDPLEDRVVEVAMAMIELESGRTILSYERRINPDRHIPAGAVAVHGITDADVIGCPRFAAIATGCVALLGQADLIVAHNGLSFDLPLLRAEVTRAGLALPPDLPPVFDTMLEGRGATFDGKVPSLGEFCFAFDTDYDPDQAHRALYDVEVMLKAFRTGWLTGRIAVPGLVAPVRLATAA